MNHKCLTPGDENPPYPPFQRGVLKSPFIKGGFRGIWFFTLKPAATKFSRHKRDYRSCPRGGFLLDFLARISQNHNV